MSMIDDGVLPQFKVDQHNLWTEVQLEAYSQHAGVDRVLGRAKATSAAPRHGRTRAYPWEGHVLDPGQQQRQQRQGANRNYLNSKCILEAFQTKFAV